MRANMTQDPPYLRFDEVMKKWGVGTEASILQDLAWQREVDGNANRITQFKETIGVLQDFTTYLFIKPESAFVTIFHLTMKYVAISKMTGSSDLWETAQPQRNQQPSSYQNKKRGNGKQRQHAVALCRGPNPVRETLVARSK